MIDEQHLDRQTAGDVELQRELLALFLGQLDELRTRLAGLPPSQALVSAGDLPHMVHRLCGAARAVGGWRLGAALERAERALAGGAFPDAVAQDLRQAADSTVESLASLIAAREPAGLAKDGESR